MLFHLVLSAIEFPNDNPALSDPCGVLAFRNAMPAPEEPMPEIPASNELSDESSLEDDGSDIIVVDELTPLDFEIEAPPESSEVPSDPFAVFVQTLVEVARDAGCTRAAALMPALLEGGRVEPGALTEATVDALVLSGMLVRAPEGLMGGEEFRKTARAWRAILRGDSEDMSECGPRMLDEWAADVVARLIAAPAKTEQLRRELRTRGVAAFGLVLAA